MSIRRCKSIKSSLSSETEIQTFSVSPSKDSRRETIKSFKQFHQKPGIKKIITAWDLTTVGFSNSNTKEPQNFQIRNPVLQSKRSTFNITAFKQVPVELDLKVQEIEEVTKSVGFTFEVFKSYQEVFAKIIEKCPKNKEILKKVKTGYETWIKLLTNVGKNFEVTQDSIKHLNENLELEKKERNKLLKKINELTSKNKELSKEKENAKKEVQEICRDFGLDFKESLEIFKGTSERKVLNSIKVAVEKTFKKMMDFFHCFEKRVYKVFNALGQEGFPIERAVKRRGKKEIEERWKYYNEHLVLKQCSFTTVKISFFDVDSKDQVENNGKEFDGGSTEDTIIVA